MKRLASIALLSWALLVLLRGNVAGQTTKVEGRDFFATMARPEQDLRMTGRLFVPQAVDRARFVWVVVRWGNGPDFFGDEAVRKLAASVGAAMLLTEFQTTADPKYNVPKRADQGGADGLLQLVQQLARDAKHETLAQVPFLFWGHSAAGPFGSGFAAVHPERTIAFVRYHSGPVAGGEVLAMSRVPGLFIVGGKDTVTAPGGWVGIEAAKALWQFGRSGKAPWTFAVDPEADHASTEGLSRANALVIPWVTAIVRQRLQADGGRLSDVPVRSGWVGNIDSGALARSDASNNARDSWLPDESSARAWRELRASTR